MRRQPRISTAAATPIGPAITIAITPAVAASCARASSIAAVTSALNRRLRMPMPPAEVPTDCEIAVNLRSAAAVSEADAASIRAVSSGYQTIVDARPGSDEANGSDAGCA